MTKGPFRIARVIKRYFFINSSTNAGDAVKMLRVAEQVPRQAPVCEVVTVKDAHEAVLSSAIASYRLSSHR